MNTKDMSWGNTLALQWAGASWTMSHWYASAHSLCRHILRYLGKGNREGQRLCLSQLVAGANSTQRLSIKFYEPTVLQNLWEGGRGRRRIGAVPHLQSQWKAQPSAGSLSKKLTVPEQSINTLPIPNQWEWGGLEAVQQELTRCSFDQQQCCLIPGNICNPLHYRGPKFQLGKRLLCGTGRDRTVSIPGWGGGVRCHSFSHAHTNLFYKESQEGVISHHI